MITGRWSTLAIFLAAEVLFFLPNRAAYKAYFSGDDLDKMGWSMLVGNDVFYNGILTPKILEPGFRPVGNLYYRYLGRAFKLYYPPFVAVLQAFHVLNVILIFVLLRRLGFPDFAATSATLFYVFHAALIDAYWQPQYFFEVLTSILCLTTVLLFLRGHWILGLIPFWLAYKTKEIAVALPAALLAFEWILGERKWKRLIPYFLISINFGLQALWHNRTVSLASGYVLRFSPQTLWSTISYYSSVIFFVPFLGFAILLLPFVIRDRRLYAGLIFMVCLFGPMFVLPGRLERVYWYIPMIGLCIALSAVALRTPRWVVVLFFAVWIPVNYVVFKEKRRSLLAVGDETRWYTTALIEYSRHVPKLKAVVYQSIPRYLGAWGIEGAIHHAFGFDVATAWYLDGPNAQKALSEVPMAIVGYYPPERNIRGLLRTKDELASYIRFTGEIPIYQFGAGWEHDWERQSHIGREAGITLLCPKAAKQFEIVATGTAKVTVAEDEQVLGTRALNGPEAQSLRWDLSAGDSGNKRIVIRTEPNGIFVRALGYVTP